MRACAQFDEAVADFSSAIKLQPTFGDAYKRRGQVLVAAGKVGVVRMSWTAGRCSAVDAFCSPPLPASRSSLCGRTE